LSYRYVEYVEDLVKLDGCRPMDEPPVGVGKEVTTPLLWEEWPSVVGRVG